MLASNPTTSPPPSELHVDSLMIYVWQSDSDGMDAEKQKHLPTLQLERGQTVCSEHV